jgi:hypothetical protein
MHTYNHSLVCLSSHDADLTAPELRDILADVCRPEKGKGREVEVQLLAETDDSDDNSDTNDPWTWHE